jgi:tetratricopeptide (TPR) repeat protein
LRAIHAHIRGGQVPAALSLLRGLEQDAWYEPLLLQSVAECYMHCTKHEDAYRCHLRATSLAPSEHKFVYNLAASAVALGRLEEAEQLFDRVIALEPRDFDAWQNRSTLRTQTAANNHIPALERAIANVARGGAGEAALCYALSKELEDVGEHERSFTYLQRGARARRAHLSYRVDLDVAALDEIRTAFDAPLLQHAPALTSVPGPIFVLGLPRSGTTLVDRMLSLHSAVASLGEINDLPLAVMQAAGAAPDKLALIRQAARADFAALGQDYLQRLAGYEAARPYLIDKTPLNFLYLGAIRLALPSAKIVHVRRHPLDSGYAMYKTLFRMGYPFSYDLEDLGRYMVAQHALMRHWRAALPGGFLDIDYETLVREPVDTTRRMLDWCGLPWEAQCVASHLNRSPAATASAAQVREPIHTRSVGAWERHAAQLEPLRRILDAGGVLA